MSAKRLPRLAAAPGLSADMLLEALAEPLGENLPKAPLSIEVVRELTQSEAEGGAMQTASTPAPTIRRLRQSHHQLAKFLAQGRSKSECSLITGYSLGDISNLESNEIFQQLVREYAIVEDLDESDLRKQRHLLALTTLNRLQRITEDETSDKITTGQLQDQLKILLPEGVASGGSAAANVGVVVSFDNVAPRRSETLIDAEIVENRK